jgi:Ni/Co efflux regulator RcnB
MTRIHTGRSILQVAILAAMLAIGPAMADNNGKGNSDHRSSHDNDKRGGDKHDGDRRESDRRDHFERRQHDAVRAYYDDEHARSGRCPPGLAKKHNGCMPPGQARKWQMNQPLPRDVTYYQVPRQLVVQIGQPPSGYRYVRVSSDILLMAVGTRMVVDAIQDLGRS